MDVAGHPPEVGPVHASSHRRSQSEALRSSDTTEVHYQGSKHSRHGQPPLCCTWARARVRAMGHDWRQSFRHLGMDRFAPPTEDGRSRKEAEGRGGEEEGRREATNRLYDRGFDQTRRPDGQEAQGPALGRFLTKPPPLPSRRDCPSAAGAVSGAAGEDPTLDKRPAPLLFFW